MGEGEIALYAGEDGDSELLGENRGGGGMRVKAWVNFSERYDFLVMQPEPK